MILLTKLLSDFENLFTSEKQRIFKSCQTNIKTSDKIIRIGASPQKWRAEIIYKILTHKDIRKAGKEVCFEKVTITGNLNISYESFNFPLTFKSCTFEDSIEAKGADFVNLSFTGSKLKSFNARNCLITKLF